MPKLKPLKAPPRSAPGPRSTTARQLHALERGGSFTAPYLSRSTVTALASYWGRRWERVFVSRREGDLIRVYRLA